MQIIISIIIGIIYSIFAFTIVGKGNKSISYSIKKQRLQFIGTPLFSLVLFIFTTEVISCYGYAGESIRMVGILFILLYFYLKRDISIKWNSITCTYMFFIVWVFFCFCRTHEPIDGIIMLIKLSVPLFFIGLGYNSVKNFKSFVFILKSINTVLLILFFITGIKPIYNILESIPFLYQIIVAKYYVSWMYAVPLLLYGLTKEKKYILYAFCYALIPINYLGRTSIGMMFISLFLFLFFYYKIKAIPYILIICTLFISILFFVPEVSKKMFRQEYSIEKVISGKQKIEKIDDLNTSGRETAWNVVYDKFYMTSPIIGIGLGNLKHYLASKENPLQESFTLLHNDWLLLLCETGIVGVILLTVFFLNVLRVVHLYTWIKKGNTEIHYSAIMAISCLFANAFHMYYVNALSNPLWFCNSFIFIGIFLNFCDKNKQIAP